MRALKFIFAVVVIACGASNKIVPETSVVSEAPAINSPEDNANPWANRQDLIAPPPPVTPSPVDLPHIERFTLANGLEVIVIENHEVPVVSMELAVRTGSSREPMEKRSLADFVAQMLTKGTKKHDSDTLARAIDQVGATIGANAFLENTSVSCQALSKELATCMTLLPEVVISPSFPNEEMAEIRDRLVMETRARRDAPDGLARDHFNNVLWGENHARGWPITLETINAITKKDLIDWHKAYFRPNNAILAIAGDVDAVFVKTLLAKEFASWKKAAIPEEKTQPSAFPKDVVVRLVDKPDQTQSQLLLGHYGISRKDPDYFATLLCNYALGGGAFSSRLMKIVRSEAGKAYDASSFFEGLRTVGEFRVSTSTRNEETLGTLRLLLRELEKMRSEGPTEGELAAAQANLAGSYPLRFQSASAVANAVLSAELLGLNEEDVRQFPLRVAGVTLEEAKAAARKHFDPKNLVVVIVGKGEEVGPMLTEAGLVFEKVGYLEPISRREREARQLTKDEPPDPQLTILGKKLLDEALKAKGGEGKVKDIRDLTQRGKVRVSMQGQALEGDYTRLFEVPSRMKLDIFLSQLKVNVTVGVDESGAWQKFGPQPLSDLPKPQAEEARLGLWRDRDLVLLRHKEPGTIVQARGKARFGTTEYDAVTIRRADGAFTKLLLYPGSHLIFRQEYEENGAPAFEEYGEYRDIGGIQFAFKEQSSSGGQIIEAALTEIIVNAGLPADAFDRPK